MHALLVKHADKRHGVNGSLCHVHHKIWHTAATEAALVVTQFSSERALDCFGFSCLKTWVLIEKKYQHSDLTV